MQAYKYVYIIYRHIAQLLPFSKTLLYISMHFHNFIYSYVIFD